jgi:hypothetical protein
VAAEVSLAVPKSRGRKKKGKAQLTRMSPQVRDALLEQRAAFISKFGREPGPDDPVIFDPSKDVPTPIDPAELEGEVLGAMRKTGVPPEIIYAYRKTGRLLLRENRDLYPREAQSAWDAAIDEYFRLEAQAKKEAPTPSKGSAPQLSAEQTDHDAQS